MAIPYFYYDATHKVYFRNGMLVPYGVTPSRPQSVGVAENGKLKVYDHSLAGTYKRRWKLKAIMDNSDSTYYKFSDFRTFVESTVVWTKIKFTYYDKDATTYTVRIINYSYEIIDSANFEVTITLEEDYT